MYVTITHGPNHPTTVYGLIDYRHLPVEAGPAQSATITPLHPAGTVADLESVLPYVSRISRTATAIANSEPAPDQAGPVALLGPVSKSVTAIR